MHPQRHHGAFPYDEDGETTMVVGENVPVRVCAIQCGEQLSGPEAVRFVMKPSVALWAFDARRDSVDPERLVGPRRN